VGNFFHSREDIGVPLRMRGTQMIGGELEGEKNLRAGGVAGGIKVQKYLAIRGGLNDFPRSL